MAGAGYAAILFLVGGVAKGHVGKDPKIDLFQRNSLSAKREAIHHIVMTLLRPMSARPERRRAEKNKT